MAIAGIGEFGSTYQQYSRVQKEEQKPLIDNSFIEAKTKTEKKAPYSYLADASGYIQYKGVIFYCDNERQTISLGDITEEKKVLTIPLEGGGCLKVNRDNLGELSRAISMFSPGDIKRILSAVAQDTHCTRKVNEIEELENTEINSASDERTEEIE